MQADGGAGTETPERVRGPLPGSVASLLRPADDRHGPVAQLLITWAPLSLILLGYAAAKWVSAPLGVGDGAATNRLGLGLHVQGPAAADRSLFGDVPTVWLQERLVDGSPHWYDAVAALVYVTHFVSIPVVTAVMWFALRERFTGWVACVLGFTVLGVGGYVVYPAAPPWLAADLGVVGAVDRISGLGWQHLHLDAVGRWVASAQDTSNPVAAMPSLHAGAALLITLFLWPCVTVRWRAVLACYVLLMAGTLVYTGEHYVVDVLAGWLTAGTALAATGRVLRTRSARRLTEPCDGERRGTSRRPRSGRAQGPAPAARPPGKDFSGFSRRFPQEVQTAADGDIDQKSISEH